jgi:undecaprenyl diphosphate synthase
MVESIEEIHKMAEQCTGIRVNLAINYGGRREIMQAAQKLAYDAVKGLIDPEKIDEAALESRLYTAGLPDPDLLIRTGSEQRISNFLLWQAAYAELYFTKVLWPSFGEADLLEAIAWFQARNRRFGGV